MRDKAGSAATLINEGCKIVGTITGTGSFLVNGEIDGDCEVDATVTLAPDGILVVCPIVVDWPLMLDITGIVSGGVKT